MKFERVRICHFHQLLALAIPKVEWVAAQTSDQVPAEAGLYEYALLSVHQLELYLPYSVYCSLISYTSLIGVLVP